MRLRADYIISFVFLNWILLLKDDMRLSKPGLSRANAVTACLTIPRISLCLEVPLQLFTEIPLHMRGNMHIIQPAAKLEFKVRSLSSYSVTDSLFLHQD